MLVTMLEKHKHAIMKRELLKILLAALLMGAAFAVAQTSTDSAGKAQKPAIQADASLVPPVNIAGTNSATTTSSNTPPVAAASAGKTNAQGLAKSGVAASTTARRPQPPGNLRIVPPR